MTLENDDRCSRARVTTRGEMKTVEREGGGHSMDWHHQLCSGRGNLTSKALQRKERKKEEEGEE